MTSLTPWKIELLVNFLAVSKAKSMMKKVIEKEDEEVEKMIDIFLDIK